MLLWPSSRDFFAVQPRPQPLRRPARWLVIQTRTRAKRNGAMHVQFQRAYEALIPPSGLWTKTSNKTYVINIVLQQRVLSLRLKLKELKETSTPNIYKRNYYSSILSLLSWQTLLIMLLIFRISVVFWSRRHCARTSTEIGKCFLCWTILNNSGQVRKTWRLQVFVLHGTFWSWLTLQLIS